MVRCSCFRSASGFTMVELAVVMVLLSVLLTMGIGSFARLMESSRLRSLTNDLLVDLHLTRSEAILRGVRVAMCVATDENTCATSRGWHRGWLMFVDANNNGLREASEQVLRYRAPAPAGWILSGNSPVARYVSYDALGATRLTSGGFQAGTVTVCQAGSASRMARQVVINSIGRPRSQEATVNQCV
jgi:type IV fimbrial biogenesis protein FimT